MNRSTKWLVGVVAVVLALLLVVGAVYVGFGALLVVSDHATYYAPGQNLGDVDYDAVVGDARAAGYRVEEPRYVNARSPRAYDGDTPELEALYGDDVRVWYVTYQYGNLSTVELTYPTAPDEPSRVVFSNWSRTGDRYTVADLPPREWVATRLAASFEMDEATAAEHAARFEMRVAETNPDLPTFEVDARPDPTGARAFLRAESETTGFEPSVGEGTFRETYVVGENVGTVTYLVPNAAVTLRDGDVRYIAYVDQLGGVRLEIRLPPGEEIDEANYRATFRELFETVGLPPDAVDGYEFEYSPGNW
ncbi:hypothetical protein SAMN04487949_2282 [Halogranum gelatinilyticum]|uniref:Uncharacterized protein n=1 Tax=Halogranum gelatinilyticum TaxID=660521 RepID=A0A1G9UPU4_9EURY|nr:hypothetical protein [Halogranum gelatinilyticum]SDM61903.1 hypothetical protein SAMN04487949_2282 [Halogranum gelatinilyticum]